MVFAQILFLVCFPFGLCQNSHKMVTGLQGILNLCTESVQSLKNHRVLFSAISSSIVGIVLHPCFAGLVLHSP